MDNMELGKKNGIGPWLTVEEAAGMIGLDEVGFIKLIHAHAKDLPKSYAGAPDGDFGRESLLISPLTMISLFLVLGRFGDAHLQADRMERYAREGHA